jgi:cell division protein FtsA
MSRLAAAIDFGTSKIAIVAGRLDERGALSVAGAGQQYYAGFREDEWLDVEGLEEAILSARKAAEKQMGRRIKDLYVAVPGEYVHVEFNRAEVEVKSRNGLVERDDIEELIAATGDFDIPEGYIPLHRTPVVYIMENQTRYRPPLGEKSKYLSGYVSHVLAKESFVEAAGATLGSLGIGVLGMVAGPVGTGYMIRMDGEGRRTAVVIDAGHFSTDVIVAEGDSLVFHENLPFGGNTITTDISLVLGIPPDEAEKLKRQLILGIRRGEVLPEGRGADGSLTQAQEVAEYRVWEMSYRIADVLDDIGISYDGQTGLFLTGSGLGMLRGAKDILSASLGKIVKTYSRQSPLLGGPAFTTAAGSLFYALNVLQGSSVKNIVGWFRELF